MPSLFSIKTFLLLLPLILFPVLHISAHEAQSRNNFWTDGWSVTGFGGQMTFDDTSDIFIGDFNMDDSYFAGLAVGKELFPLTDSIYFETELQAVQHFGDQDHQEFNLVYLMVRFNDLFWDDYIDSSFAIGNGISYASEVPAMELLEQGADGSHDVLNYVLAELTFSIPNQNNWHFTLRYHHRSGMFELYGEGVREASTGFAAGLKFNF